MLKLCTTELAQNGHLISLSSWLQPKSKCKGNQSNSKYHPNTYRYTDTHTYNIQAVWHISNIEPPSGPFPPSSYQLTSLQDTNTHQFHPLKQLSRQPHQHLGDGGRQATEMAPYKPHLLFTTLGNHLLSNLALLGLTHNPQNEADRTLKVFESQIREKPCKLCFGLLEHSLWGR